MTKPNEKGEVRCQRCVKRVRFDRTEAHVLTTQRCLYCRPCVAKLRAQGAISEEE